MRFTVTWRRSARDELARIWLAAADRGAVSEATNEVDVLLGTSPEDAGEDFYGDRLLVMLPLSVVFSVRGEDRVVEITQVWSR
jgi:hypothetical protein